MAPTQVLKQQSTIYVVLRMLAFFFSGKKLYVKKQFENFYVSNAPRSSMLFVNGAEDDATTCAYSREVAKLTEQP